MATVDVGKVSSTSSGCRVMTFISKEYAAEISKPSRLPSWALQPSSASMKLFRPAGHGPAVAAMLRVGQEGSEIPTTSHLPAGPCADVSSLLLFVSRLLTSNTHSGRRSLEDQQFLTPFGEVWHRLNSQNCLTCSLKASSFLESVYTASSRPSDASFASTKGWNRQADAENTPNKATQLHAKLRNIERRRPSRRSDIDRAPPKGRSMSVTSGLDGYAYQLSTTVSVRASDYA